VVTSRKAQLVVVVLSELFISFTKLALLAQVLLLNWKEHTFGIIALCTRVCLLAYSFKKIETNPLKIHYIVPYLIYKYKQ
jgi:hypothetical protein